MGRALRRVAKRRQRASDEIRTPDNLPGRERPDAEELEDAADEDNRLDGPDSGEASGVDRLVFLRSALYLEASRSARFLAGGGASHGEKEDFEH
jgi:hypothetical protein